MRVSIQDPTIQSKRRLYSWVARFRKRYRDGKLDNILIKKAESIPGWTWQYQSDVLKNKEELLRMARAGEPKPKSMSNKFRQCLNNYTIPSTRSYDPVFLKQLQDLRPDWFGESSSQRKKRELIELAQSGHPRPTRLGHPLGVSLSIYTSSTQSSYDEAFTKQIVALRPDWFQVKLKTTDSRKLLEVKKQDLFQIAHSTQCRPASSNTLGQTLLALTSIDRMTYDAKFDIMIRSLRPDWFVKNEKQRYPSAQSLMVRDKKVELLRMARDGEPRPLKKKTSIGAALSNYTNATEVFDPEFNELIRQLRPDWFSRSSPAS
jgi:chorismate mutase